MSRIYLGYKPMKMLIRKTVDDCVYQIVKLGNVIKESDELEFYIPNSAIEVTPEAGQMFQAEVRYNDLIEKFMPFKKGQFKFYEQDEGFRKLSETFDKATKKLNFD